MANGEFWNQKMEKLPREEIKELQLKRLKAIVRYSYDNTSFQRGKFKKIGVTPEDIKTIEDFQNKVPTMLKDDIRSERSATGDLYGGSLAVPKERLSFMSRSTGTTGLPTLFVDTEKDIETSSEQVVRAIYALGLRKNDICFLTETGYLCWELPVKRAVEKIGAKQLVFNTFFLEEHIINFPNWLIKVKANWFHTGTRILHLYNQLVSLMGNMKELLPSLKFCSQSGDILSDPMRNRSEKCWGVPVYDHNSVSEMHTWGWECPEKDGIHWYEDLLFLEAVDPQTGESVGPSEEGDLTFTVFDIEAQPHLRWRTEDIGIIKTEPCNCGRTHARTQVLGREAFSVIVGDKTVHLRDVEDLLWSYPETSFQPYQLVRYKTQPQSKLIIRTALTPTVEDKQAAKNKIEEDMGKKLGLPTIINLIDESEVRVMGHKMQKVLVKDKE
ncbi:MAG: phenylacetate--CoA ligase family protein [Candidatus Jordarchaeum sp.]|uniref:phenylacetate--CoA ligase family protein n=1 Tax=Candidatus Jordarchaeum sp. TaxID=2823881 RepID=UPI00404ACEE5